MSRNLEGVPYHVMTRRTIAAVLDWTLLSLASAVIWYSLVFSSSTQIATTVSDLFALWIWPFYYVTAHALTGQTIGKRVVGIRVLTVDLGRIDWAAAAMRDIVPILLAVVSTGFAVDGALRGVDQPTVLPLYLAGVLGFAETVWNLLELATALTNKRRRAVHDYLAGTVVVREET